MLETFLKHSQITLHYHGLAEHKLSNMDRKVLEIVCSHHEVHIMVVAVNSTVRQLVVLPGPSRLCAQDNNLIQEREEVSDLSEEGVTASVLIFLVVVDGNCS